MLHGSRFYFKEFKINGRKYSDMNRRYMEMDQSENIEGVYFGDMFIQYGVFVIVIAIVTYLIIRKLKS
ncbi:hypothetical protein N780_01440 [Pontibacillus chungwhensis BH030062]|uniref:Uncharacterized protein n=1 Tax=Pontibacillus chungwhensis BH030062 TaxID=1385513 RepID=A0A0A2VFK4_9BACI|nr:hypothetical protein N780_01440 [Pontibacillus chungwhensis BH030062]